VEDRDETTTQDDAPEACGRCRYFEPGAYQGEGTCRRQAPPARALLLHEQRTERATLWPPVHADDWCGEWQPTATPRAAGAAS
jgi:hypothetical protein